MLQRLVLALLISLPASACPNLEELARNQLKDYVAEEAGKPQLPEYKLMPVSPLAGIVFTRLPGETGATEPALLFFGGVEACALVLDVRGEIAEQLSIGETRYLIVRHEFQNDSETQAEFSVVAIKKDGIIEMAHDQHGQEISMNEAHPKRCRGETGESATWQYEPADHRMTLRQRHTERDGRCRVTEDSSHYLYYTLTNQHWQREEAEESITVTEDAQPPVTSHYGPP